jgi:hypothetical protein
LQPREPAPVVVVAVDAQSRLRATAEATHPSGLVGALRLVVDRAPHGSVGDGERHGKHPGPILLVEVRQASDRFRLEQLGRPLGQLCALA